MKERLARWTLKWGCWTGWLVWVSGFMRQSAEVSGLEREMRELRTISGALVQQEGPAARWRMMVQVLRAPTRWAPTVEEDDQHMMGRVNSNGIKHKLELNRL